MLEKAVTGARHPGPPAAASLKPASVIALFIFRELPYLLFIEKADVSGYPWRGQMAFPGGHSDSSDLSREATALRELEEEMNISAANVAVLGSLGHFVTINHTEIKAFAGIWNQKGTLRFDPSEISRTVEIPFHHLLHTHLVKGFNRHVPAISDLLYPYEEVTVWGVTAKIVHHLLEILLPHISCSSFDLKAL